MTESPYDISLLRHISVDFDLEWSEQTFLIKIAESSKVVFQISNKTEEATIKIKLGEEEISLGREDIV